MDGVPSVQSPPRRRPRAAPRHSAATLRAGAGAQRHLRVAVALVANLVVAVAKLGAGLLTGSSALLAEAAHSGADSVNQVLLGVSLRRSGRPPDAEHPFGYGGARFLWAFLAAISSFLIGGCVSVSLALGDLAHPRPLEHLGTAWVVLGVAAVGDGASLLQTLRQSRRSAASWNQPSTIAHLRMTSEPTLRALFVEDTAALVGVALAASGLLVRELGGPASSDAIASLLIGLLLGATAIGLARPLADLLIGKSLAPQRVRLAHATLASSPAVDEVLAMYTLHVAPEEAIIAAQVHPAPDQTAEQLAARLDELDLRLRRELPEIGEVFIDVTANRRAG
jgi:cation diffusion facilitator family transporter